MKKWIVILLAVMITSMIFWSCSDDDSSTEPTNDTPTCIITSPTNDAEFTIGYDITVNVDAADTDGTIAEVRFYFDGTGIGTDTSFPYSHMIPTTGYSEGTYTIKATAKDNDGAETSSQINVNLTETLNPGNMVYVQGGNFQMGDHFNEGYSNELPLHSATVSNFYMGATEVTNKEYCDMLNYALGQGTVNARTMTVSNLSGDSQELLDLDDFDSQISFNGTSFVVESGRDNYPVLEVTWYGSAFYCNTISDHAGYTSAYNLTDWSCNWSANGYRLPTETEWEYASRGGIHNADNYHYSGSDIIDDVAWYDGNNSPSGSKPVGTKAPNQLGIYDMSGNLLEWCWDWYESYTSDAQSNPTGPTIGSFRVVRGGFWNGSASYCSVSYRNCYFPNNSPDKVGFRISRTP